MSEDSDNPLLDGLPLLGDLPDLDGAHVLVRVDFNVPLRPCIGAPSMVTDAFRIRAALPTLNYLLARGATVTACTHLGRPAGAPDIQWDLAPVRDELARLAPQVELLENLRFDPGEEENDPSFVEKLINGQDAYVNDAFGVSHRNHASVVGPPSRLPSAAGFLLQREIEALGALMGSPARPFVAVVGGAKVADKLGVLKALLRRVDVLIVGGGMSYTFLAAAGHDVGDSLVDETQIDACRALLDSGKPILLPTDIVALEPGATFGCDCSEGEVQIGGVDIPAGWQGLDMGPATVEAFAREIGNRPAPYCGTDRWGSSRTPGSMPGPKGVARAVAESAAFTVVGGGDSAAAVDELGLSRTSISFISTGGGASLELLEYGDLPGLAALRRAVNAPPRKNPPSNR
jgi:phosphoglycerate kinase